MFLSLGFKAFGGLILALSLVKPAPAVAQSVLQSEEARHKGFYEHQNQNKDFDREREAGLKEYLKDQADWEDQRKKDRAADKGRKKTESPIEGGPEYKADRKEKYDDYLELEAKRKAYIKDKKSFEAKNAKEQEKRDAWALEEYGLDKERPRFDIAKRNLNGTRPSGSSGSGGSGSFGGGGGGGNFAPNFPPPPSFDDDGYVPPPFPPAESFEPPPEGFPPPPPMPVGDPGADFDGGYFPPPPPPIPAPEDGF